MAKRVPLVCQHLETVSRKGLEKHQDIVRNYIRKRHGIYALYRRGKLHYVGLAKNLTGRLRAHLRDRHGSSWDRFSVYLTIGDSHMKELESLLLRIVKPTGNKQGGRFFSSENLRRRLSRDFRRLQREEWYDLIGRHPAAPSGPEGTRGERGPHPVLSKYASQRLRLRARFKGQLIKARVRRDGRIRFRGKLYNSPSRAAAKACGRRTCNGWTFWNYERAPGDWVPLRELRR